MECCKERIYCIKDEPKKLHFNLAFNEEKSSVKGVTAKLASLRLTSIGLALKECAVLMKGSRHCLKLKAGKWRFIFLFGSNVLAIYLICTFIFVLQ